MKRLLWVMIAMFLLQPVFSSIKLHEHFIEAPAFEQSWLVDERDVRSALDFNSDSSIGIHQQSEYISHKSPEKHQDMDCCQTADMSSCLMGCYFIPLASGIVAINFKTISPLDRSIVWLSHLIVVENPPPRLFV